MKLNGELNRLSYEQWKWVESKGWHNKTTLECLALIAGEVGEAINECRGAEPTRNLQFELVDIILRTIDLSYHLGYDIEGAIEQKMKENLTRNFSQKVK